MRTRTKRLHALAGALALAVVVSGCRYTGFADGPSKSAASLATEWVKDQQNPDGGFEQTTTPGFETPDAILAIAENAQQQVLWNTAQGLAAVLATTTNGNNPLHYIDNLVDSNNPALSPAVAAKIIVLVAKPLGLSVTSFDPDRDGAKNLLAVLDAGLKPDGTYGFFNQTMLAAQAKRLASGSVPASTVAYIRNSQKSDGSWDFAGSPTGTGGDADSTSAAVAALAAANVAPTDPDLRAGLAYLAQIQRSDGAWESFGDPDPNSTSVAMLAITAGGFDPGSSCWRDTVVPARRGQPYVSPAAWLRARQITAAGADQGRIQSPVDSFGVNTFATDQSIQAFRRAWLPVTPVAPQSCA